MKKILITTCLCAVLACSGCENDSNVEKNTTDITKVYEEETESENNVEYKNDTESIENVQQLFNAITEDMLNACDTDPSSESYWNDSLVFLNQFNNARLYGIGVDVDGQTAMLLYIDGEKVNMQSGSVTTKISGMSVCMMIICRILKIRSSIAMMIKIIPLFF